MFFGPFSSEMAKGGAMKAMKVIQKKVMQVMKKFAMKQAKNMSEEEKQELEEKKKELKDSNHTAIPRAARHFSFT